ncbi:hypothetical protein ABTL46_22980, partial [Acinetobacter baumannii]
GLPLRLPAEDRRAAGIDAGVARSDRSEGFGARATSARRSSAGAPTSTSHRVSDAFPYAGA